MLPADALPLVSCVMPTANRRGLVPHAIRYFLRQAYPHKELVILDDGTDAVADLVPDDPQVRYVRLGGPLTLGAKRNEGVRLSRGGLIMHWDDDDWMAPHRIRYQVDSLLQQAGAEVCGLRRMLFHDVGTGRTWLYEYPASERPWLAGGSLLYTRAFWQRSPFPAIDVGEDTQFVWSHSLERAVVLPEYRFYVATIHPGNTSPKACAAPYWTPWPGDLQSVMGEEDMSFYRSWPASWSAAVPATAEIPDVATGGPAVPATAEAPGIAAPAPADAQPPTATAARAPRDDRALPRDYGTPHSTGQPATYSIVMVTHNTREMTQMATLRTLRHSAGSDARLIVVDNGSTDGTETWLDLLAQRGDIDLIRSQTNLGHGPAIELARRAIRSPYLVTLDSDAFPLVDDWLSRLASRLNDRVTVAGIRHHRDYIHPSCLIMPCNLLDDWGLTFLDEKDRPSQLDVAERISHEVKRRGYQIAGLERTGARRRGSVSEPVYLGAEYE
ncbi:MAG: glycosyltransferase, partial [Chloroflexota bacterium]